MQTSDEQLFRAGDLGALYRRHRADLSIFVAQRFNLRHMAEDIVQHVFLKLCEQPGRKPPGPFRPWVYSLAANFALAVTKSENDRTE